MAQTANARAYPLAWPLGWKRAERRESSTFTGTQEKSFKELLKEIDRLVLGERAKTHTIKHGVIVSTNIPLRQDGIPYSNPGRMTEPGVAVYFEHRGKPICIASDKYDEPWKNMKAIAKTIEALRGIERWGASELLDRAFVGFNALPEHASAPSFSWRNVFELSGDASEETVKRRYRELSKVHHPDAGGDAGAFAVLTKAYDDAKAELGFA